MSSHIQSWRAYFAFLFLLVPSILSKGIADVTDIEIFSLLPPCAASAVSIAIYDKTSSLTSSDQTALHSVVCSNPSISKDVATSMSTRLTSSCGPSATDDVDSAYKVYSKYCNPDAIITFATPTVNIVNAYITDLSEMTYMPPCAQAALSAAVMDQTSKCPKDASLFAPCVCNRGYITDLVSETLATSVKYSCSNTEDITFAQGFYQEYCAMNNGTTTFTPPTGPPGDMTYYITALPQFQSLNTCAQSGIANVFSWQTEYYCASGPQAMASCICIKSGMKSLVSSSLTYSVKNYCDSTATAVLSSALDVFEYYCSAAESKVVATVTQSIAETYATAESRTGPSSPGATHTGNSTSGASNSSEGGSAGGPQPAVIAAGALGGVVALGLIGVLGWFIRRKKQQAKEDDAKANISSPLPPKQPPYEYQGTPELVGSDYNSARNDITKPAGAAFLHPELGGTHITELPNPDYKSDFGDNGSVRSYGGPQELASPVDGYQQVRLHGRPVQELSGGHQMGWRSGPIEMYEMDAQPARRH